MKRLLVPALCLAMGWFYLWTARSSGDPWNFGAEQSDYYNLLIDGWLDGQLNLKVEVPEDLLRAPNPYDPALRPPGGLHDASFYRGKYYLYFGAAPVVTLMLPFRGVTGVDLPMPVAILVFTFGGFLVSVRLWQEIRHRYFPEACGRLAALGVLALGGASMGLVLVRRANVWELPLSSGYCFAMIALLAIFRSLHAEKRNAAWLALASLALGLAVASRPTYLFAAAALLAPVVARWSGAAWRSRVNWLVAAVAPVAVVGAALALHNYARFGNPLEFGTKYMLGGANEAEARYFSPAYFGYNVDRYFLRPAEWLRYFPFIFQPASGVFPRGYYGVEEVYGVLPGFLILWCVPLAPLALWRREASARRQIGAWLVAAVLLAAGPAFMLCCFWAAMARYQPDFLPALVMLGGVGALALDRLLRERRPSVRWALRTALAIAMMVSIAYGVLQSMALYDNLRRLNPRTYATVARAFNTPTFLWEKLTGTPHGPIAMEVKFTPQPPGTREPLIGTGVTTRQDRLFLVHESGGGVRFGGAHDGGAERLGPVVYPDFAKSHRLRVEMGSLYPPEEHLYFSNHDSRQRVELTRWWRVELDRDVVFEAYQRFHPASRATLRVGKAVAPRGGERPFSGELSQIGPAQPSSVRRGTQFAVPSDDFDAVRIALAFPAREAGAQEPLVSAGDVGRGDFVFAEYLEAQRVRFGFDHWGKPMRYSEPVAIRPGERVVIEVVLGSFSRDAKAQRETIGPVRVRVDGRVVWEFETKLYPIEPEDVFIGNNPIGGTSAGLTFTGPIHSVDWLREGRR